MESKRVRRHVSGVSVVLEDVFVVFRELFRPSVLDMAQTIKVPTHSDPRQSHQPC